MEWDQPCDFCGNKTAEKYMSGSTDAQSTVRICNDCILYGLKKLIEEGIITKDELIECYGC